MARKKKLSREDEDEVVNHMQRQKPELNINTVSINFKCKTENQKKFINLIKEKVIVIGAGYAGTGKTFLSCAEALRLIKTEPQYRRIMLVKSVTVLKGEEVGFLKGTLDEKLSPFMESFKDNFTKLIGKALTDQLETQGIIQVQPLTYLRGRTIDNTIIIVDEAQNISYDNMKTILTRIGENSKIIIIGDQRQVDLKNKKESCLAWLAEKFKTNNHFGVTEFLKEDQVRNPIISVIEDMFDELPPTIS
jgi:phosphate starvation-inducible PhoH-like protein